MWVHPKKCDNDTAIMGDDIITERERRRGIVPAFKQEDDILGMIACRLYLKVTMLSEIIDAAGHNIEQWALHSEQNKNTNTTTLEYPYQPNPLPIIWTLCAMDGNKPLEKQYIKGTMPANRYLQPTTAVAQRHRTYYTTE